MMVNRLITSFVVALAVLGASAQQYADSMTVYFRQGQSSVDLSYMDNDSVVGKIRGYRDMPLSAVIIHGTASPEGSTAFNGRLSRERAMTIAQYFNIPDSLVTTSFTVRDWEGLQSRVKADSNVPFKSEVELVISDIIGSPGKACAIDVLRNMHNGRPYRYLYDNHFPYLRRSQIIFLGTRHGASVGAYGAKNNDTTTTTVSEPAANVTEIASDTFTTAANAYAPLRVADDFARESTGYIFALKTNLLYDAALIPNIGVEFPIGPHFSLDANWMYAWWKNHARNRHWRIYGGDMTARYWFNDGARMLDGHHIGIYGTVLLYQVAFGGKGYISGIPGQNMTGGKPWIGGGVEYGYSLNVHPRLNIDFSLGIGYTSGEQRVYRMIDDCYVWQSSSRKQWFGPTKAEITLVWKIGRLPQARKEAAR